MDKTPTLIKKNRDRAINAARFANKNSSNKILLNSSADQVPVNRSNFERQDYERWLRAAMQAWESAANDALDRATKVLEPVSGSDMSSIIGNILDIGGALLSPMRPWVAAVEAALAVVVKDIAVHAQRHVNLEDFRLLYLQFVAKYAEKFEENIGVITDELLRADKAFKWSRYAAEENAILRVIDVSMLSKSAQGKVRPDPSRIRAKIELEILLKYAGMGEFVSGSTGGMYPIVVVEQSYTLTHILSESGEIQTPDHWKTRDSKIRFNSRLLRGFDARIHTLIRILKIPITLFDQAIITYVAIKLEGFGKITFVTKTDVWQPSSSATFGGTTTIAEGVVLNIRGLNNTLRIEDFSITNPALMLILSGYAATTPRYHILQNKTLDLGLEQIFSAIILREVWKGPMPALR